MTKKVFVHLESTIDAEDMNRLETLRCDVFNEATTKEQAREAIGAITINHAHGNASPNLGSPSGTAGFISGADINRLYRITTFPGSTMSVLSPGVVFPIITQAGTVEFVTLATLQTMLGGGGGGGGTTPTSFGGEAEDNVISAVTGGEAEDNVISAITGGEAEDSVLN